MYVTFDYRCRTCGLTESRFVKKTDRDRQFCQHTGSDRLMDRLPPATRTTFKFADSRLKD